MRIMMEESKLRIMNVRILLKLSQYYYNSADYEYFEATAEDIDNALRGLPEV